MYDMTPFDKRLEQLHQSRKTPEDEIKRAINVYERFETSKAICIGDVGEQFTPELQISVFNALDIKSYVQMFPGKPQRNN